MRLSYWMRTMGNVIVMAVRHRNLDVVESLDFATISGSPIHQSDRFPKQFSGAADWSCPRDRHFHRSTQNVLFSQYYHSSSSVVLYLDDEMMVSPGKISSAIRRDLPSGQFEFESIAPVLKKELGHAGYALRSGRGNTSRETAEPGDAVSIFLLCTDNLTTVEKNPHVMKDVVDYCRTGKADERTFGDYGSGITPVGTVDGLSAAIITVFQYQPAIHLISRFVSQISNDELLAVTALHDQDSWSEAGKLTDFLITRELCAAFGYKVEPKNKSVVY